jgi:Holliday junction resolvase RusA-like endonuclease
MTTQRRPLRELYVIRFDVHGVPISQGSKTVGHSKGRTWVRDDNDKRLRPWRSSVAAAAAEAMSHYRAVLLHGPVRLDVEFRFPRPRGHYGTGRNADALKLSAPVHHTGTPDLDKLVRSIGDALTGIVLVDDSQIVHVSASKSYGQAGATVTVEEIRV